MKVTVKIRTGDQLSIALSHWIYGVRMYHITVYTGLHVIYILNFGDYNYVLGYPSDTIYQIFSETGIELLCI